MRRAFLIVGALVVAIGLILWLFPVRGQVLDGGFDLSVRVSSSAGPLRSVSCEAFGRRPEAEQTLENLWPPETRLWSAVTDSFAGEPLTVHVPVTVVALPWGQELQRRQLRFLVIIGQLADGRRVGKLVDIPDCQESREVNVVLR